MALKVLEAYTGESAQMYGICLSLVIGTWDEFMTYRLKKHKIAKSESKFHGGQCQFIRSKAGYAHLIIWIPHYKGTINELTNLSHECTHAAMYILETINIKISFSNHEAFAYLQEHILNCCLYSLSGYLEEKK